MIQEGSSLNLYRVYVHIPEDVSLREVVNAGLIALGFKLDAELAINYLGVRDG